MRFVIGAAILVLMLYLVWWGYKNLLKREREEDQSGIDGSLCHLCREAYPLEELVVREKRAGFENYFCGKCISELAHDYNELVRKGRALPVITSHVLDGDDGNVLNLS